HDHVHRIGAHQHVGNLQCLFAEIGLADQELVSLNAQSLRVGDIERMFGIDEGSNAALSLHVGYSMQHQCRFAARFWSVDLDDASARIAADAQRYVQAERPGGNHRHVAANLFAIRQAHDGPSPEFFLDTGDGDIQRLQFALFIHETLRRASIPDIATGHAGRERRMGAKPLASPAVTGTTQPMFSTLRRVYEDVNRGAVSSCPSWTTRRSPLLRPG